MDKQNKTYILPISLLIAGAAFTRLFPHYPNFTAIGAMAIFGGSVIKDKKYAFLLPLAALFISDVCLHLFTSVKGFYGTSQLFVYAAFILITALASLIKKASVINMIFASFWSGIIFFAFSNFGTWISGDVYPISLSGLSACFIAAIPFYKNEFFGNFLLNSIYANLFYSACLFLIYKYIVKNAQSHSVVAERI